MYRHQYTIRAQTHTSFQNPIPFLVQKLVKTIPLLSQHRRIPAYGSTRPPGLERKKLIAMWVFHWNLFDFKYPHSFNNFILRVQQWGLTFTFIGYQIFTFEKTKLPRKDIYIVHQDMINHQIYPVTSATFLFLDICARDFHRLSIYTELYDLDTKYFVIPQGGLLWMPNIRLIWI